MLSGNCIDECPVNLYGFLLKGIYVSRVISAILEVPQVQNVSNLTINGNASDLVITLTGTNVKLPVLGTVTLIEN